MKIGVISDTHDFLDPKIPDLFAGVDHILHAGDVGTAIILFELEQIAPVTAVLGNNDDFLALKETEIVPLSGLKFLLHHIVNPQTPSETLQQQIAKYRPDVVVFGHSHRAFDERIGKILFFNPGYSGKPRLGLARTAAILHCDAGTLHTEWLRL
jgi:hypothetical protein